MIETKKGILIDIDLNWVDNGRLGLWKQLFDVHETSYIWDKRIGRKIQGWWMVFLYDIRYFRATNIEI